MKTMTNRALPNASCLATLIPALLCAIVAARAEASTPVFRAVAPASVVRAAPASPWIWTEQKVTASNGMPHDAFGQAIAIRGTTALIGAVDVNNWEGAIYVFTQKAGVWTEGQEFMADDGVPGDQATFGTAIMIDGTTAVIGALGATVNGHANQGAVYVFTETDGIWSQVAKLVADDGEANNYFGQTAAISGPNIVVGAYGASVNGNALQGAAYVFTNVGGTWTFAHKLTADDGVGGEFFGRAVAMSGTRALVGAPYTSVDGTPARGAVYVYDGSSSDWTQVGKVVADEGNAGDGFGYSLAASATTMVVGAGAVDAGQGAAFVFADDSGTWTQDTRLVADDGAAGEDFGYAVAVLGNTVMVGADRATVDGATQQGAAYIFTGSNGNWTQTQKLIASDGAANEFYGAFVGLSEQAALVGVPYATVDGNAVQGAAYFYARDDVPDDTIFADGFDATP
jgi:FG-GAP repeat protein